MIRYESYRIITMVARQGAEGPGSGATRSRSPGRPRSAAAHQAILEAARELLVEDGFTRLRLEHVAARAGGAKSAIYGRWTSKQALTLELLLGLAGPHLEIRDVGNTRSELLAAVENPIRAITETTFGPVIRAMMSQISGTRAIGDPFRSTVVAARRAEIGRVVERGIARGDLRPDADPSVATELLAGPVYFRLVFGGALEPHLATWRVAQLSHWVRAR